MLELRRFVVWTCLLVLAGIALHRAIGARADAFTGIAIIAVAQACWRARKQRLGEVKAVVVELRQYEAEDRRRIVDALASEELRGAVADALAQDGSESKSGSSETFPFPAVFRRRATMRYWRAWALSAGALLVAASLPDLSAAWRVIWLAVGIALTVRARRMTHLYRVAASVIEINPFRISYVRPNGLRHTVSFADGARCEDVPEHSMFIVRSGEMVVPVSYSLIGFNRIAELVERYGAIVPTSVPPAS